MIHPKKSLGQHFLHDPNIICRIIDFGRIEPGEPLLEIGPGRGALTRGLLERSEELIAVEYDATLAAEYLTPLFDAHPRARLLVQDIRQFQPGTIEDFGRRKAFGNLPYYLATHVILDYSEPEWNSRFSSLIFMVQREVGARLCASPGTRDYGYLTVLCRLAFEVERGFRVSPGAFTPPPKVDSMVVRLTPRNVRPAGDESWLLLKDLLRLAFGQRRKTLSNSLKGSRFDRPEVLQAAAIPPGIRAEGVSPEQYVELVHLFARHSMGDSL